MKTFLIHDIIGRDNCAGAVKKGRADANGNPLRLAEKTGHISNYDESKVAPFGRLTPAG